jgi:hypothetical protein
MVCILTLEPYLLTTSSCSKRVKADDHVMILNEQDVVAVMHRTKQLSSLSYCLYHNTVISYIMMVPAGMVYGALVRVVTLLDRACSK